MRLNNCPLVLVEWIDSQSEDTWTTWEDIKEDRKALTCFSVGWLMFSNSENITIVSTGVPKETGNAQATHIMCIPQRAINRVWKLSTSRKLFDLPKDQNQLAPQFKIEKLNSPKKRKVPLESPTEPASGS